MESDDDQVPTEYLEELAEAALRHNTKHQKELRRSVEIGSGFYDKLAALSAGSLAIVASVGIAVLAKFGFTSSTLRSFSHWLVCIAVLLWIALLSAVIHNLALVHIANLEAAISRETMQMALMRELDKRSSKVLPSISEHAVRRAVDMLEAEPRKRQRKSISNQERLLRIERVLGFVSITAFISAYSLVVILLVTRVWQ